MIDIPRFTLLLPFFLALAGSDPGDSTAEDRGRISGTVVSAETKKPIAGAYVGTGDFGDSGGSNYARHREQGLHARGETDSEGRFVLSGLAFTDGHPYLRAHPLVIRHPEYVPHTRFVPLARGERVEVEVALHRAASIRATVAGAADELSRGSRLLRLEALDGHAFIPPGKDPHLTSFAASTWLEHVRGGSFTFTGLEAGDYAIDAFSIGNPADPDGPFPTGRWRYHGGVSTVTAKAGERVEVRIEPELHGTRLLIVPPRLPAAIAKSAGEHVRRTLLVVSRNPGLLIWSGEKTRSLEDARLGRIQKGALFYGFVPGDAACVVENLPAGVYSVFAGPGPLLHGVRVDLARGEERTVDIAWRDPSGVSLVDLGRFDRRVEIEAREYRAGELCSLITEAVDSRPPLEAAPSIRESRLTPVAGPVSVWELLEGIHAERGWVLREEGKSLVLEPAR